jgi:hypothetical protein
MDVERYSAVDGYVVGEGLSAIMPVANCGCVMQGITVS